MTNAQAALMAAATTFSAGYNGILTSRVLERAEEFLAWLERDLEPKWGQR